MHLSRSLRIAVIDDHPLFREGLLHLLATEPRLVVAVQAASAAEALAALAAEPVDFAIVDLSLKDSNGLDLLKDLAIRHPGLPALVVSMHDEAYYAARVRAAGGRGYVRKQDDPNRIIDAIRCIAAGGEWFAADARPPADPVALLSDRELGIFEMIGQGLGSKEIAATLGLSVKTVETYKDHIKTKLGRESAAELLKFAVAWKKEGP